MKKLTYIGLIVNVAVFLIIFNNISRLLDHWVVGLLIVAVIGAISSAILNKE